MIRGPDTRLFVRERALGSPDISPRSCFPMRALRKPQTSRGDNAAKQILSLSADALYDGVALCKAVVTRVRAVRTRFLVRRRAICSPGVDPRHFPCDARRREAAINSKRPALGLTSDQSTLPNSEPRTPFKALGPESRPPHVPTGPMAAAYGRARAPLPCTTQTSALTALETFNIWKPGHR